LAWATGNSGYWKRYRETHPDYVERNRSLQQSRNQRQREDVIANEDSLTVISPVQSGRYRLLRVTADGIANEDELIVEITVLSKACADSGA
jgi:hypothetical protein